jgi:hypothetical protein
VVYLKASQMARNAPILTAAVGIPTGRAVKDALRGPAVIARV